MTNRIHLVVIDPENDFCKAGNEIPLPSGLPADAEAALIDHNWRGSLYVEHAHEDMVLFDYAKYLYGQNYDVNSIQITITDGVENYSRRPICDIGAQLLKAVLDEFLASHLSILIGINDSTCKAALIKFKDEAEINYYTGVADATPESLAKVAGIVSSSVSSQSSARASGKSAQLTI